MISLRSQLKSQLACFDDEAFTALANRGLLRRAQKDLEKQTATVIEESRDTLLMALGDYRISFNAGGPAQAQCSCPAMGVCQHILAAAISLQRLPNDNEPQPVTNGKQEDPLAGLHAALMQLNSHELVRHAGKQGYRWAWQFVLDLSPESGVQINGENHIVIRFAHPRMTFRYMGGDLGSLVADVNITQIEKYRVAAVLAYQRAQGAEITPPEPSVKARNASLDLGKDHALPESIKSNQYDSRARLRSSVKQLLEECIALGLSHLSRGIHERYSTLAVWAQGAEYPRLALLLRRLADHVDLLLERAGSADEHRLLDEMTLAFALVSALDDAAARQIEPAHLVGRARTQYETTGEIELLGLGASAWRSASGYIGLTILFWSPKDQAFLSCTDARPENQRGFNPIARYKAAGPWSGLGAPAQATGRRVMLSGAQINAAGRLSTAESTTAIVQLEGSGSTFAQQLKPCENWAELSHAHSIARRSLLSEPQPMKDWAVLLPTRFDAAKFDTTRQTLVWPLFDENNQRLDVELIYSEQTAHAIARIEQFGAAKLPVGTMLIVRIRSGQGGLVGEPLSLVRTGCKPNESPIDSLYFDPAPEQGFTSKWLNKINQIGMNKNGLETQSKPLSILPNTLNELRHYLQRQTERGVTTDSAEKTLAQLSALTEKTNTSGLTAFTRIASNGSSVLAQLLQANYLYLQYEQLLENAGNFEGNAP